MDELFAACCVGVDVERAYELGHVECVQKASSSVDAYEVARACVLYSDYRTALKTRHLFPEGTQMLGPVLKFCRRNDNRYTFFDTTLNAEIRNTRREWLEYFESSRFHTAQPFEIWKDIFIDDSSTAETPTVDF